MRPTIAANSENSNAENLRREARIEARIPVIVVQGRKTQALETLDVSFKGLFLRTEQAPALRSLVKLRVALPLREIEAHAMAVHVVTPGESARPGVGLQFWGLAGPDRTAWDDYVRELITTRRISAKRKVAAAEEDEAAGPHSGVTVTATAKKT